MDSARPADQSHRRRILGPRHLVVVGVGGACLFVLGIDDSGLADGFAVGGHRRGNRLMFTEFLGRLMGVENLQSINSMRLSLTAPLGTKWSGMGAVRLRGLGRSGDRVLFALAAIGSSAGARLARRLSGDLVGANAADARRSGVEDGFHQPAAAPAVGAVRWHREHGHSRRNDRLGRAQSSPRPSD